MSVRYVTLSASNPDGGTATSSFFLMEPGAFSVSITSITGGTLSLQRAPVAKRRDPTLAASDFSTVKDYTAVAQETGTNGATCHYRLLYTGANAVTAELSQSSEPQ